MTYRRKGETDDEFAHRALVERAERAEQWYARRNEPMTRGDILDAIEATRRACDGNVGDHHDAVCDMLDRLRSAFE